MNSDHEGDIFVGICFTYTTLGVIFFAVIMFFMIANSLDSQGVLLVLRDIVNIIFSLLFFLSLIIAFLFGSVLIVRQTKNISLGFRSMKYSFLIIFAIDLFFIFFFLFDFIINPPQTWVDGLGFSIVFGGLILILIAVLISLFFSFLLLKLLVRINFFSLSPGPLENSP